MPIPLIAIAIPVVHSSGMWIATSAAGYLGGTLASTWVGAFILGNSTLLASLGLVSAAGVAGAMGVLTGAASATALGIGSALTTIGLGGVASTLGIAPVATFLGLTPVGWAIAGGATVTATAVGFFLKRRVLKRLNEERVKGGLAETTIGGIIEEIRAEELRSMIEILTRLEKETPDVRVLRVTNEAEIEGKNYRISDLAYQVNKDGSELIVKRWLLGLKARVFCVKSKGTTPEDGVPT